MSDFIIRSSYLLCEAFMLAHEKTCLSMLRITEISRSKCLSYLEFGASSRSRRNIGPSRNFPLQRRRLRIALTMSMVIGPFEGIFIFKLTAVNLKIITLRQVYTYNSKV